MPELPEVQTIASQLSGAVVGQRIRAAVVRRRDVIRAGAAQFEAVVAGRTWEAVERQGKRIVCRLSGDRRIVFHLGMSGRISLVSAGAPEPPHTHVILKFSGDASELRFHDPRRFGGIWLLGAAAAPGAGAGDDRTSAAPGRHKGARSQVYPPGGPDGGNNTKGLRPVGPDALTIRADALRRVLSRNRQVKALLMDQQALAGLGNIYCDEALFDAGIHPLRRASNLSADEADRLARSIRRVLAAAVAAGGSSLRDYRDADGAAGWFQTMHRVYGREGEACARCGGVIVRIAAAGRSTHLCPKCQPKGRARAAHSESARIRANRQTS